MNRKICFFEPDRLFGERLIDYWTDHGLKQQILYYSDADKWFRDSTSISADLWILDRSVCTERFLMPTSGRVVWWNTQQQDAEGIFKYRSAEILLRIILGYLYGGDTGKKENGTRLISMYSPIKRCLQTTFGLSLAHLLSTKGRVLYLNLEGYSGMDCMLKRSFSKDISDFIYYVNQTTEEIPTIISNYIYRLGDVDMIPPVLNPANLQEISKEMWLHMLRLLKESGLYDYILVDVSDFILGTYDILRESQVIFSMIKSDVRAEAKWQQYCSVLEASGYGDILDKTRQQEMPHITELPADLAQREVGTLNQRVMDAAREAGLL